MTYFLMGMLYYDLCDLDADNCTDGPRAILMMHQMCHVFPTPYFLDVTEMA